jgi:cyclomaltodextrinase / maltogenic alpha-amylase / neopullulanase
MQHVKRSLLLVALILTAPMFQFGNAQNKKNPVTTELKNVEWAHNAVIYEVNVRQFSKEGTFNAFEKELPRLKDMGVDIIWLMPVNPIGEKNRKGTLGSYYSVRDYKGINPEFGNMDDFKHLVKTAHSLGVKVIIDWVPNHTSWDSKLFAEHPEYYMKDSTGKYVSPYDWTDVIRLDYSNEATCRYMTETMQWWLKETDIDGFRCDVAMMMPQKFWDALRPELTKVKPVFMLAESDQPFLHERAFDATYDWKFHHIMNNIAKGKEKAYAIANHFAWVDSVYPAGKYLMQFTSNHDENSWNGSEYERLGEGAKTFAVLAATVPDMMLIYTGQESGFNRRLNFFEKDSIDWGNYSLGSFYKTLTQLKHRNKALWNGLDGGSLEPLTSKSDSAVFAFVREKDGRKVFVLLNLSGKECAVKLNNKRISGDYTEVFSGQKATLGSELQMLLLPWEYKVFEAK